MMQEREEKTLEKKLKIETIRLAYKTGSASFLT